MFGPNRPPIPGRLAQRIWRGEFIEMEELLPENAARYASEENPSKAKEKNNTKIVSPLAWVECFQAFTAVVACKSPERVPDLLAYSTLIVHAARQFEGDAWLIYDRNYRQQAAAMQLTKWAEVNTSLWTLAFSQAKPAPHCSHCMSVDHRANDCPKSKKLDKSTPSQGNTSGERVLPICRDWNFATCRSSTCRFRHVCLDCHGLHPQSDCRGGRRYHPYREQQRDSRPGLRSQGAPQPFQMGRGHGPR